MRSHHPPMFQPLMTITTHNVSSTSLTSKDGMCTFLVFHCSRTTIQCLTNTSNASVLLDPSTVSKKKSPHFLNSRHSWVSMLTLGEQHSGRPSWLHLCQWWSGSSFPRCTSQRNKWRREKTKTWTVSRELDHLPTQIYLSKFFNVWRRKWL